MKNDTTLTKADDFSPAFELAPPLNGSTVPRILVKAGTELDDDDLPGTVELSGALSPGCDYAIIMDGGRLLAVAAPHVESIGGFHVDLSGDIRPRSFWDLNWLPKCGDAQGMELEEDGKAWNDIYPLNENPGEHGTSRAGVPLASGTNPPWITATRRAENLNWFTATEVLARYGKRLPTAAEYIVAAAGVKEGATCGSRPTITTHVPDLRSRNGLEQATGTLWWWSCDQTREGWCRLLGGDWDDSRSGARALNFYSAFSSYDFVGARGRCDHLILL